MQHETVLNTIRIPRLVKCTFVMVTGLAFRIGKHLLIQGDAFGVKRIFDFIAALWLKMNAFFPHGVCVCVCVCLCASTSV